MCAWLPHPFHRQKSLSDKYAVGSSLLSLFCKVTVNTQKSLINSWYLLRVNKCLPFWSSRSSSCFIILSFCTRIVQVRVKCTLLWQQNRFDYKTLNIWLCDDWLVLQVCCFATRFLWRTLFEIVFPRYIYMNERCSCFLRNYITGFCQLRLPRVTRLVWSKQKPVAAS